jgi:hypothetical protein
MINYLKNSNKISQIHLLSALIFIIVLGIYSQNIFADPPVSKIIADFMDEGAWAHSAKSFGLNGHFLSDPTDFNYSYFGAPIYTVLLAIFFKFFGISSTHNRYFSLVCFGLLLSNLVFFSLKRDQKLSSSLLIILIFTLNHDLFTLTRFGTPLLLEIYFFSLGFNCLTLCGNHDPSNDRQLFYRDPLFWSGITFSLALLSKLTGIFMVPAVSILVALSAYRHNLSRKRIARFILGYSSPITFYLILISYNHESFLGFLYAFVFDRQVNTQALKKAVEVLHNLILPPFFLREHNYPFHLSAMIMASVLTINIIFQCLRPIRQKAYIRKILNEYYFLISGLIWYSIGIIFNSITHDVEYPRRFYGLIVPLSLMFHESITNPIIGPNFKKDRIYNQKLKKLIRFINFILLVWFLKIHTSLTSEYFSKLTFTQHNASLSLKEVISGRDFTTGINSWLFSLDNSGKELFLPLDHHSDFFKQSLKHTIFNHGFGDSKKNLYIFEFSPSDDNQLRYCILSSEVSPCDYLDREQRLIGVFSLFPRGDSTQPLLKIRVTKILNQATTSIHLPEIFEPNSTQLPDYLIRPMP